MDRWTDDRTVGRSDGRSDGRTVVSLAGGLPTPEPPALKKQFFTQQKHVFFVNKKNYSTLAKNGGHDEDSH